MTPQCSVVSLTDADLTGLVSCVRRRLVVIAPGLSLAVAEAIVETWRRLGPQAVQVVLDPDPEVCRMGYGDIAALKLLQETAEQLRTEIHQQPGLRIGDLAADGTKTARGDLDKAVRSYLAWQSIEKEKEPLNLTPFQVSQVEQRLQSSDQAVRVRIPETFVWLLVPGQKRPEPGQPFPAVEWQEFRLQGQEWLAERASKKLKNDGLLVTSMAGSILRFEIDQVPLWRGKHVGVKQLVDDFSKYPYLPRVKNTQVILDAIQDGVSRLTWSQDTFAYADYYDAAADRYRGLEAGRRPTVQLTPNSVVVQPEVAAVQMEKDAAPPVTTTGGGAGEGTGTRIGVTGGGGAGTGAQTGTGTGPAVEKPKPPALRRFHGTAKIDATRLSRDVDQIASAVVQHLSGLLGAKVNITIEIEAEIPSGAPDNVVRTVTENCRTLKFDNSGFEES